MTEGPLQVEPVEVRGAGTGITPVCPLRRRVVVASLKNTAFEVWMEVKGEV